jgi:hypothetical protein
MDRRSLSWCAEFGDTKTTTARKVEVQTRITLTGPTGRRNIPHMLHPRAVGLLLRRRYIRTRNATYPTGLYAKQTLTQLPIPVRVAHKHTHSMFGLCKLTRPRLMLGNKFVPVVV